MTAGNIGLATGERPDEAFKRELDRVSSRVYSVGDRKKVADLLAALSDAYSAGLYI